LIIVGIVLLLLVVAGLIISEPGTGPRPQPKTATGPGAVVQPSPANTPSGTAKNRPAVVPLGRRPVNLRYRKPANATGLTVTNGPGSQEVRFSTGAHAVRVRAQAAGEGDSLGDQKAFYSSQGNAQLHSLGGHQGVLVTSDSNGYVSQLFVFLSGGRIFYVQVISYTRDKNSGQQLLASLARTARTAGS
jgi:hypothetical protein